MLNLSFKSPDLYKKTCFPGFLAAGLMLSGCQTMPWSDTGTSSNVTPSNEENPSGNEAKYDEQIVTATLQQPEFADTRVAISEPKDIWYRLKKGFALEKPQNKRLQREYDWYRKHPEYLVRVQERAEPFLYYILNEVERRELPAELVLLPVVESAFQPFAYSPGRAAGLWQFIPSTGKMYGLQQNWWYDGRRDIVASTNAALDYLTALSRQFDGDWELALAAYNAGAGNVRKAIRKNRQKNKPTDYWSLPLPRETQTYVPRLLAISKIIQDSEKLNISLKPIPDKAQLGIINMDTQIDLAKAAEMAGISIDEMYQLNPAFNRWATSPEGSYDLLLPVDAKPVFEEKLALLDKTELLQWQRYKIRQGDSLSRIAKKHQTTTSILKEVNKLNSSRIRAGKHLLIPVALQDPDSYRLSASQRLKKKQAGKRPGERLEHVVQPGDTLWDLAREHKVSHKQIAQWNGIAPADPLRPGQKLVIWVKNTESSSTLALSDSPANRISNIRYTIRKGDSLSRIASKFNVTVNDLKKWNDLKQKYIQPGQTLKLSVNVTEQL